MAQDWKVSKAFLSTDKDTKEPQIVSTPGGDKHKFMVQVDNQPVPGWMSVLKKVGNKVEVGDTIYGDIVENNWGKPQFNRAQKPFQAGAQPLPPQNTGKPSSIESKLDYIISLLENQTTIAGSPQPETVIDDVAGDDEPVDLSAIDY